MKFVTKKKAIARFHLKSSCSSSFLSNLARELDFSLSILSSIYDSSKLHFLNKRKDHIGNNKRKKRQTFILKGAIRTNKKFPGEDNTADREDFAETPVEKS
ncbi:hypothetical protein H5410_016182 [Solanum commersonii]|uniref:Uncharacterized protein n=1 Tax=Solanum commersonii TaxID=4109 RepID=A0A9J5ZVQ2_SOLCO|nr:hypothetical protein H5410_016182 [Solanum commersonii]